VKFSYSIIKTVLELILLKYVVLICYVLPIVSILIYVSPSQEAFSNNFNYAVISKHDTHIHEKSNAIIDNSINKIDLNKISNKNQLYNKTDIINDFNASRFLTYENSTFKLKMQYPFNWQKINEDENSIIFRPPSKLNSDVDGTSILVRVINSTYLSNEKIASIDINDYRRNFTNFSIVDSGVVNLSGHSAYKVVFTYKDKVEYKVLQFWSIIGSNTYSIIYKAEINTFPFYIPIIQKMVSSVKITVDDTISFDIQDDTPRPSSKISPDPYNIAVNSIMNTFYITNFRTGTISVIDSSTDNQITNVTVGDFPLGIDFNPVINKIYVANYGSNSISVIDGTTNKVVTTIPVGNKPTGLKIDSNEIGLDNLIFVSYESNNSISVIDGTTNKVVTTIPVGNKTMGFDLNPVTNKLFVADQDSKTLYTIDYFKSKNGRIEHNSTTNVSIGKFPTDLQINPNTNKLYLADSDSNSVYVINASNNKIDGKIPVQSRPEGIEIIPVINKIYVANYGSNSISVIDGTTNKVVTTIPVGERPFDISFNSDNNILYVTNLQSNSVSEINSTSNKVLAGIDFNSDPVGGGYISCNGKTITNKYIRYEVGTELNCKAIPNGGYTFSTWSSDISGNLNDDVQSFDVSSYEKLTANFIIPFTFSIPKEYLLGFFGVIPTSLIFPPIIRYFISRHNAKKQRIYLEKYIKIIDEALGQSRIDETLRDIDRHKNQIEMDYVNGKISELTYTILKNRISEYSSKDLRKE
jgi:YVTN family beta-propeller protein